MSNPENDLRCLWCDGEMLKGNCRIDFEDGVMVVSDGYWCTDCGECLMNGRQMNELRQRYDKHVEEDVKMDNRE